MPAASITSGPVGFYGTTRYGGTHDAGSVYRISKTGNETVLHSFGAGSDGAVPQSGLRDVNGVL
ncbi:MAG: choice-of-anchor tandem repeat GloVer-containing protein, partial [Candidatus Tumulicola sp.]